MRWLRVHVLTMNLKQSYELSLLSSSDDDDDVFYKSVCVVAVAILKRRKKKKDILKRMTRKCWMQEINYFRKECSEFKLFYELTNDQFRSYFRMKRDEFEYIHTLIENDIKKMNTNYREAISTRERLAITLRFLITGTSYAALSKSYRIGRSTLSKIVPEVCESIWTKLQPLVMKLPTQSEWKYIANQFDELWNFKNCLGAIDGKHIVIFAPDKSGSQFFNYKHTFSIVLLAVADAHGRFIMIDVGSMGRFSDGGIFTDCHFYNKLQNNELRLPADEPLYEGGLPQPYVFIGDCAFPLMTHLLKPYPDHERLDNEQLIFNYRLSRARRMVESAFGKLVHKFRIFLRPMDLQISSVKKVVKAACVLHNYVISNIIEQAPLQVMTSDHVPSNNVQILEENLADFENAFFVREYFKEYFNTIGSVVWQNNRVKNVLDSDRRTHNLV